MVYLLIAWWFSMAMLNNQRVYNSVKIVQGLTYLFGNSQLHFVSFPRGWCRCWCWWRRCSYGITWQLQKYGTLSTYQSYGGRMRIWWKKCFGSCAVHRFYSTIVNLVADPKESASSFKLHHRFFFIFNGLVSGQIYSFYPWMGINCDSLSGQPKIVLLVIHANPRAWKYQCFLDIMPHICWLHAHIGLKIVLLSNATKYIYIYILIVDG